MPCLMKICKIQSLGLLFLVAYISFYITSADIFHNVLELYSKLSEKTIFITNFPFLTVSLTPSQPPPPPHHRPLNRKNPLSATKVFCQCSKAYHGLSRLLCYDDARKTRTTEQNPISIPGSHQASQKHLFMTGKLLQEPFDAILTLVN